MRVLLAEDDLGLQHIYSRVLHESGHEVIGAISGDEALTLLQNNTFDVALIDVLLPKVNGMQLLEYVASADHLKEMQIVLMSANRSYEVQAKHYSRTYFLAKPFHLTQLRDLMSVFV